MNFRIRGLEARQFDHLFALSDAELAEHGAVRRIADGPRPCRISLSDAKPGDELKRDEFSLNRFGIPKSVDF